MASFTTAETARKMTDAMRVDKEVDKTVLIIIDKIEAQAMSGESKLILEKNDWSRDYTKLKTDAINKLRQLGYCVSDVTVTRSDFDNHNKPYDVEVTEITW